MKSVIIELTLYRTCERDARGRFKKGHVSYRPPKGVRLSPATEFKKGQMPHNHLPVGSEVIDSSGYTKVKVAEPNKWRFKHVMVWEAAHGQIPKGHIVIFADGNKRNLDPDNLIMITRAQHGMMNMYGLKYNNAELTKTGLLIADVRMAAHRRQKGRK